MSTATATETSFRLAGCHAGALDAYLRGMGLVRVLGRLDPQQRFRWNDAAELELCGGATATDAVQALVAATITGPSEVFDPVETPWRGRAGKASFIEIRNSADDALLPWFDAVGVPGEHAKRETSERTNNPLLGQGGSFGRSELVPAIEEAYCVLVKAAQSTPETLRDGLAAVLCGTPLAANTAKALAVDKKVLGAYQSGRGTGPGSSARDRDPSGQHAWTNAWDLMLVVAGLTAFSGNATRRALPGARAQASFPLVVLANAAGTDPSSAASAREDDARTYEVLVPLWRAPARAAVVAHAMGAVRLRVGGGFARDALDAVIAQVALRADEVGFDRLVRFVLFAPSDPRYRFALRRGQVEARASTVAGLVAKDILPFRASLDRQFRAREHPPESARRALRAVEEASLRAAEHQDAASVRGLLDAVVAAEGTAARCVSDPGKRATLHASRFDAPWGRAAGLDRDPSWGVGLALAGGVPGGVSQSSWLRTVLLPWHIDNGRYVLDPTAGTDITRASRPLPELARVFVGAARQAGGEAPADAPWTATVTDLHALLANTTTDAGDLARSATIAARIAVPEPAVAADRAHETRHESALGVGRVLALLVLAAQPVSDESVGTLLARRALLAAPMLAGNGDIALRLACRELWRRELSVVPPPVGALGSVDPVRVAIALFLTFDASTTAALTRRVLPPQPPSPPTPGGA